MSETAKKTDPKLWDKVKTKVTKSAKGGKPGQWSARKAQMATQEYKKEGGGYAGQKGDDNHLKQWTDEEWGTRSGEKSGETGERYLPKKARAAVTDAEYDRSTAKKRADSAKGKQFSKQPKDVAKKTAAARKTGKARSDAGRSGTAQASKAASGATKADLMKKAKAQNVSGRSKMSKAELARAVHA